MRRHRRAKHRRRAFVTVAVVVGLCASVVVAAALTESDSSVPVAALAPITTSQSGATVPSSSEDRTSSSVPASSSTTTSPAPESVDLTEIPGGLFEGRGYDEVWGSIDRVFGERLLTMRATDGGSPDSRLQLLVFEPRDSDVGEVETATGLTGKIDILPSAMSKADIRALVNDLTEVVRLFAVPGFVRVTYDWRSTPVAATGLVGVSEAPDGLADALKDAARGRPFELQVG